MSYTKEVAAKVRKLREIKGYSQEYLAQELEMSNRQYQRIEAGDVDLTLTKIEHLSKLLGLTPVQLMGFDDKYVFENCTNTGIGSVTFNHLPESIIAKHETQINLLREEIAFLRNLILKQSN